MAEGDTLARIAHVLGRTFAGREIRAARGRPGGAQLGRVVGARVRDVEARGKHLLISFDNDLTLHTHLGLGGAWHRYRRDEPWQRGAWRAMAVLETDDAIGVCFDAPTVELLDSRAVAIHPRLRRLGPDATATAFDLDDALRRLRDPANAARQIGDALLDQRILAGLGNVYRSELPFIERVDPRKPIGELDGDVLRRMLEHGHRLLRANAGGGRRVTTDGRTGALLHVYRRTARPCHRCGTAIVSARAAEGRWLYWCPGCQAG